MNEMKFTCPACGQSIEASIEWSGRQLDCPSCKRPITVPPPKKVAPEGAEPTAAPGDQPEDPALAPLADAKVAAPPSDNPFEAPPPAPDIAPDRQKPEPDSKASAPTQADDPGRLRVAALTADIKLGIVQAVRAQIAAESTWLPGVMDGANAYAAKVEDGKTVLVDAQDPDATRFSLMGAVLREFHLRNVTPTATGRRRFLDQEIVDAIREVLLAGLSDEERDEAPDPLVSTNPMSISHAQSLAVLDSLEERYSQRVERAQAESARRKLGTTRLSDLVRKLEKKARVDPEEVATALYHELLDVRGRLEKLESRISRTQ